MKQDKVADNEIGVGKLWLVPLSVLILSFLCGSLAKWVFVLPRGHLLWDISLILLSASIFGVVGFVIGWAIFSDDDEEPSND